MEFNEMVVSLKNSLLQERIKDILSECVAYNVLLLIAL